jgi:hypothetical protein
MAQTEEDTFWELVGSFLAAFLSWHTWHSIGWLADYSFSV